MECRAKGYFGNRMLAQVSSAAMTASEEKIPSILKKGVTILSTFKFGPCLRSWLTLEKVLKWL